MTSSRVILRLALGVLCGVVLVLLPAAFSIETSNTSSYLSGQTVQPQLSPARAPLNGLNSSGINGLSFLTIILFIFLPSTVFSLMVRRWAEKRARDYLWSDSLEQ